MSPHLGTNAIETEINELRHTNKLLTNENTRLKIKVETLQVENERLKLFMAFSKYQGPEVSGPINSPTGRAND